MVSTTLLQIVTRFLLILAVISLVSASPRPHFGDLNQASNEQEISSNALETTGLTNEQIDLLVQRLVDINRQAMISNGWDKLIRGPEMKRQSRFRQCYFNPVSCFKK